MSGRRRPAYADVMSTVAVFLALGGGAVWAAAEIGAGDIKKKAVRSKHIKPDAVRAKHLADGTPRDVVVVHGSSTTNSSNKSHEVECPGGRLPIGGGARALGLVSNEVVVTGSRPGYVAEGDDLDGWFARAIEVVSTDNTWSLDVWVTCARGVSPPAD